MRWWNVVVAVAFCHGCLRDDLVPCGERYCPTTSTCMAGRCIDPQQLVACNGVAEGDGCVVLDTAGTCVGGLCEIAGRCGDAFVDAGEICDDGNQTDGDGCSRTCSSDETCGNGILDLDETCDCGDAPSNQPLGCPTVNGDDVDAVCDTQCTRRCGDGVVTGLEACDGTTVPATCTDFGFYEGDVTCSPFCSFVRDCSGKCGDDEVQSGFGELCDGDATVTDACVDFGRDYGVLGCNQFCNPDVGGDCSFFGWQSLWTGSFVYDADANDHGYAINDAGTIVVSFDGEVTRSVRTTSTRVFSSSDTFILAREDGSGNLTFERFDTANGFVTLLSKVAVTDTWRARTEGSLLYVLDEATCKFTTIDIAADTAAMLPSPGASTCTGFDVRDGVVIAASDKLYILDAGLWTTVDVQGTDVGWYGNTTVVAVGAGQRKVIDVSTGLSVPSYSTAGAVTSVITTLGGNDVTMAGDETIVHVGYSGSRSSISVAGLTLKRDGNGHVLAYENKSVYRLTAGWTSSPRASFSEQPNGQVVTFDSNKIDTTPWASSNGVPQSVVGDPTKPHYVASTLGVYSYNNSMYTLELAGTAQLYASKTDTLAIVNNVAYLLAGTMWQSKAAPSGCTQALDASVGGDHLAVLFNCPSVGRQVYELTAGNWSPRGGGVIGTKLVLAREDGTPFVANTNGFRRLESDGTWRAVTAALYVGSFAARNANDVYYQSSVDNRYFRWNGTTAIPFRSSSPLPHITEQALALDAGLLVKTTQGNGLFGWWGTRPTGL